MSDTTTHEVSPTRTVDGHVLPAPGAWEIDPGHTDVAFIGRHFMVTKVRGRFTDVTGTVVIAPHLDDSKVEVTINMASVESGSEARDEHIKSPEPSTSSSSPPPPSAAPASTGAASAASSTATSPSTG